MKISKKTDPKEAEAQLDMFKKSLDEYEKNRLNSEQFLHKAKKVAEMKKLELDITVQEFTATIETLRWALKDGYIATDMDGDIYWYRRMPTKTNIGWIAGLNAPLEDWCFIGKLKRPVTNWEQSLIEIKAETERSRYGRS